MLSEFFKNDSLKKKRMTAYIQTRKINLRVTSCIKLVFMIEFQNIFASQILGNTESPHINTEYAGKYRN